MKTFSDRLSRLEEISESMQAGKVSLEDAIKNFEEGIKLAKGLEKELSSIEKKVEILLNEPEKPSDKVELGLFPELED